MIGSPRAFDVCHEMHAGLFMAIEGSPRLDSFALRVVNASFPSLAALRARPLRATVYRIDVKCMATNRFLRNTRA